MRVKIDEVVAGWCFDCGKEANFIPEEDKYKCSDCKKKKKKEAKSARRAVKELLIALNPAVVRVDKYFGKKM